MTITPRKNKDGKITSYTIRVYRGYDRKGNRLKPYTANWKPDRPMSEKQMKKEVQKFAVLFEQECENGQVSTNRNIKIADFCDIYRDIKKDTLAPRSYEYYVYVIESLIIPLLGHIKVSELRAAHVQKFIQYLQQEKPNTSPNTIKKKLAILQLIMTQAIKLDIIQINPADAKRLTLPKPIKPEVEIFTKQEAAEMLECLEQEELQFQVLIQLAIISGCREGELVALKFSDINYENCKLTIERAAYKCKGEPIKTKPPKDYEARTVTLCPECIDMIKLLYKDKQERAERLGDKWHDEDWLFTQWNGLIMNPQTPTKWFPAFLKKNGFKHRKFHSLRHTSATLLLYSGVDIKAVQTRLGHSEITTTNKYLHLVAEADAEAAKALGSMLIKHTKYPKKEAEDDEIPQKKAL